MVEVAIRLTVDADAAGRLTDPAGPGLDVLDGVARLYRRRVNGHPDGDALAAWDVMNAILDIAPHRAPQWVVVLCLLAVSELLDELVHSAHGWVRGCGSTTGFVVSGPW
ncbi:hypothetical protein [Nocardioides sp. SLBN-35]|uniref:hypothetical protein n=1 Tax=Nocardioides sp. SLBN-35 TaxID=2768445 RepID=UPI00114F17E1|nr:hypothetical protein [Nocardioides sp. SLBN-35]TQK68448.1 hypothetical protein FBY23_0196 [Nocardioides sp. SLBN-35]